MNNVTGKTLADVWNLISGDIDPLLLRMRAKLNELSAIGLVKTDFETSTIRFSRVEKKEPQIKRKENGQDKDKPDKKPEKSQADTEQEIQLDDEESKPVAFQEFEADALKGNFRQDKKPVINTAGPGMGKTFASCVLAIRAIDAYLDPSKAVHGQGTPLPIWLPLNEIAVPTLEGLVAGVKKWLGLHGDDELEPLRRALEHGDLLLVLDARDQAERSQGFVRDLLQEIAGVMENGRKLNAVITTRPILREALWQEFGGWKTGSFEFRQQEFSLKDLGEFLEVRLPNQDDEQRAVLHAARNPRGNQARLTVPLIADMVAELVSEKPEFQASLETGVTGYQLYQELVQHRLERAIKEDWEKHPKQSAAWDESLVTEHLWQCLGFLSAQVWDGAAGRNLFQGTEAEKTVNLAVRKIPDTPSFGEAQARRVFKASGLLEAFEEGQQTCFAHRSVLEFLRAWWMVRLYNLHWQSGPNWTLPEGYALPDVRLSGRDRAPDESLLHSCSLDLLIDHKTWDDQWQEVFMFFASYLADVKEKDRSYGRALVPLLQRVEGNCDCMVKSRLDRALQCLRQAWYLLLQRVEGNCDCMVKSRLDRALQCLRQAWYLYGAEPVPIVVSSELLRWSSEVRERLAPLDWLLLPHCIALCHWAAKMIQDFPDELILRLDVPAPEGASGAALQHLIARMETASNDGVRSLLAGAIGSWSEHGDRELLERLITRMETESNDYVRSLLAGAIGSWSEHGDGDLLEHLIARMETASNNHVRYWLAEAIGPWSEHGDRDLLEHLIARMETASNDYVRSPLANAIGSWSAHGDRDLLERLIARMETESDRNVRYALAQAIGSLSEHGDRDLLERLIARMEADSDYYVRRRLAQAIGSWSEHGDRDLLERLIARMKADSNDYVRSLLAGAIGSWSERGDRDLLERLIARMEADGNDRVRYELAIAIGSLSEHGDRDLLERLIARMEAASNDYVRRRLAEAIGSWSEHGDRDLLERLIARMEADSDDDVRYWLAEAIGSWSERGTRNLLERLIVRMETESDDDVRGALAKAIGSWSERGDRDLLERLIARMEADSNDYVRSLLAGAIGSWSEHGGREPLERLIARMETESDDGVRIRFAHAIGSWSEHGGRELLQRLIARMEADSDDEVRGRVADAIRSWQTSPAPRRFFPSTCPFGPPEDGILLVSALSNIKNRQYSQDRVRSQPIQRAGA